ncbi:hypothetical protein [Niallia sp. 03133]
MNYYNKESIDVSKSEWISLFFGGIHTAIASNIILSKQSNQ